MPFFMVFLLESAEFHMGYHESPGGWALCRMACLGYFYFRPFMICLLLMQEEYRQIRLIFGVMKGRMLQENSRMS